jgi:3-deoxy-D-arabino-heptulosonate 7-phosphate (DAHP) synthase class II
MDNEGLLAWGEYEVERARQVLERAEAHTGELREIVRLEKAELAWDEEEQMKRVKAHLRELKVPAIVYNMATNVHELLIMVTDKKVFLRRCGVAEEDLEP